MQMSVSVACRATDSGRLCRMTQSSSRFRRREMPKGKVKRQHITRDLARSTEMTPQYISVMANWRPWRCTECFNSECQCGPHECDFCGKVG